MATNPALVKYPPEVFLACEVKTVPIGMVEDIAYFSPLKHKTTLLSLSALNSNEIFLRFNRDAEISKLDLNCGSLPNLDRDIEVKLPCLRVFRLLAFNSTLAPATNFQVRLSYEVTRPKEYRYKPEDAIEVIEVAGRLVNVVAGTTLELGPAISVVPEMVYILDEVACERIAAPDALIHISRDEDPDLLVMSPFSMPDLDYKAPLWIPAINRLSLTLEATGGLAQFRFRYRYRVYKLVDEAKEAWGLD